MTRGPLRIELDELPDIDEGPDITDAEDLQIARMDRVAGRGGSRLSRWFWRALGGLLSLALGVWAWDFVTGLLDRSPVLGGIALALVGIVLAVLAAMILREWAGIARMARLDKLRDRMTDARGSQDRAVAARAVAEMEKVYRGRADTAWGLQRLRELEADVFDADALLDLAERELLGPLDLAARARVEAAAARVATLTALVPLALVDVVTALWSNLAMIRAVSAVYGGRSGTLGAWRLTRAVIGHLAATGAVAVGDDLVGPVLGHGMAAKLSRRFGEGLINGTLTIRVGVVAMEMCRPMPFSALERPSRSAMLRRALTGLFRSG